MIVILKVLSLFSGIGAFEKALENLRISFEIINYCEIDDNASSCYEAIHGIPTLKRIKDINDIKIDQLQDFDLLVWGSPCTNISTAGSQEGFTWTCLNTDCNHVYNPILELDNLKDLIHCPRCGNTQFTKTESSLLVYGIEILKRKKPSYSVFENVEGFQTSFPDIFEFMDKKLQKCGYTNHIQILNSENFGLPQHRNRCFIISIKSDKRKNFSFPNGIPLSDCPPLSKFTIDIFSKNQ